MYVKKSQNVLINFINNASPCLRAPKFCVADLPAHELLIIYKGSQCCKEHCAKLIFKVKPGDNKILKIFDFEFTWQF